MLIKEVSITGSLAPITIRNGNGADRPFSVHVLSPRVLSDLLTARTTLPSDLPQQERNSLPDQEI